MVQARHRPGRGTRSGPGRGTGPAPRKALYGPVNTMGDPESLARPGTRFTQWRLRSRSCAVADAVAAVAGAVIYAVAAIDDVASWPSNHVLLGDPDLSRIAEVLLLPSWVWLLVSSMMIFGPRPSRTRRRAAARWPLRARACLAAAVICVAVVVGGFAVGAAKGSVRVLPGPRDQVSTIEINQAAWTTVPMAQFQLWQARFVREDGVFMFFGLILTTACIYYLHLHRKAIHACPRNAVN